MFVVFCRYFGTFVCFILVLMAPKRRGGRLGSTSLRLDGCSPVLEDSGGTSVRVTRSASSRHPSKSRVPAVTSIDEV